MNTLGVSGSTIMSDEKKFNQLFKYNLEHIEIGEFKCFYTFKMFLDLLDNSLLTFGIHSPVIRGKSKYDIIEHVDFPPDKAIKQIRKEARRAKFLGAKYLLVHFPFFADMYEGDTNAVIEENLDKLARIQQKNKIQIVCEPKLGKGRSPMGIMYLDKFPVEIWRRYNMKICIDIGDYVMAAGEDKAMEYIKKWSEFIKVVHLHNVDYQDGDYFWKPVHPNDETDGHHNMTPIIKYLASLDNIYFVLEHTPHMNYSLEYILEGKDWVRELIQEDNI